MQTVGIRDLQVNPAILTKPLENNEFVMITKRGTPLGVATALNDDILHHGFFESLLLKAFEEGSISLSQLSKSLKLSQSETMKLLAMTQVPITDYEIEEELEGIKQFL
jgi:predicted HTH domain antitoxin